MENNNDERVYKMTKISGKMAKQGKNQAAIRSKTKENRIKLSKKHIKQ